MEVAQKPAEEQWPLHQDGVPLYYIDGSSVRIPIRDNVARNDDYIHIWISRGGATSVWAFKFFISWLFGSLAEFNRYIYPSAVYDSNGDLWTSPSSQNGFTAESDRFYKNEFSSSAGILWNSSAYQKARVRLNTFVGYNLDSVNNIIIRLGDMWYAQTDTMYDDYPLPTDPLESYTIFAWRSSESYPSSIPVSGVSTKTGTFPWRELITHETLTSSEQIASIHWDNTTDTITIT